MLDKGREAMHVNNFLEKSGRKREVLAFFGNIIIVISLGFHDLVP